MVAGCLESPTFRKGTQIPTSVGNPAQEMTEQSQHVSSLGYSPLSLPLSPLSLFFSLSHFSRSHLSLFLSDSWILPRQAASPTQHGCRL